MSMFEQASRSKLRFESSLGVLEVEDLWDLPLSTTRPNRASLNDIAVGLYKQIQDSAPVSFVDDAPAGDQLVRLRFDIVKHVIDVRKAELASKTAEADKAQRKQRLLAILAKKEDADLESKSADELRELITSL